MFSSSLTPKATPLAFGFGAPDNSSSKPTASSRSGGGAGNGKIHPARSGMIASPSSGGGGGRTPQGNQGSFRSRSNVSNSSPASRSSAPTANNTRKPQGDFQSRPSANGRPGSNNNNNNNNNNNSPAGRKSGGNFQPRSNMNSSPGGNNSSPVNSTRKPQGNFQPRPFMNSSTGEPNSPATRKPTTTFQPKPALPINSVPIPTESTTPVSSQNVKKRKRPSSSGSHTENPYEKREQIKATQNNLEKLMKRIGGGNAEEFEGLRNGRFNMDRDEQDGNDEQSFEDGGEQNATKKKLKKKTKAVPVGLDGKPLKKFQGVKVKIDQSNSNKPKPVSVPVPVPFSVSKQVKEPTKDQSDEEMEQEIEESTTSVPSPTLETALDGPPSPTIASPSTTTTTKPTSDLPTSLQSAKFRWLNEQLYTRVSKDAIGLMRGDDGKGVGGAFDEYHASHRHLTSHWPSPPLEHITESILALPSTADGYLIVDLGCGDAGLAKSISTNKTDGKGKRVLSFDLVGDIEVSPSQPPKEGSGWVVPGDFLSSIPLPGDPGGRPSIIDITSTSGSAKKKKRSMAAASAGAGRPEMVDVVVCCLSLMGINWVGGVYEACRVMRKGGTLHIAEVTSRLVSKEGFIALIEAFGFDLEEHTTPTTHFDLFRFRKTSEWPLGVVRNQDGWDARVKSGEKVLKGCVYKKR